MDSNPGHYFFSLSSRQSASRSFETVIRVPDSDSLDTEEEIKKRLDLRHLDIVSVDPPGCKDIDDALHCIKLQNKTVLHLLKKHSTNDIQILQTLLRLKLPTGLPAVLAGVRVAVVLALVGVVVGEFIGASRGLGALVIAAQGSMDTPLMFAVLTLVSALGLLLYQGALFLERRLMQPREQT